MAQRNTQIGNYANWQPVGSADYDQNYEPISPTNPGPVGSSYTVRNGDTLQSIARTVWGDAAMWYLLADANGLTSGSTLVANTTLTIPNKVTNVHNNAGTFRPYNPGEAMGDLNPTLPTMPNPPKAKKGCGGLGMIIMAIVAVVATIYTAGLAASAMSVAGASSATIGSTMAAGAAAMGASAGASLGAAMIGGAIGSIAGQLTGMALGVVDKFSWGAVATGAIMSGLGTGKLMPTSGLSGNVGLAANAAIRNVVGQGVGIITGQQKGFSWSSVAVSAVAAPIASKLSDSAFGATDPLGNRTGAFAMSSTSSQIFAQTGAAFISSGVTELTRVAIQGGKVSWVSVASSTAESLTRAAIGSYVAGRQRSTASNNGTGIQLSAEQRKVAGNYIASGINIPELAESPITYGFTSEDVARFQLKPTQGEAQTTPLLFTNSAPQGGGYGRTLEAQAGLSTARNGGLYVDVTGAPPMDVVADKVKSRFDGVNAMQGMPRTAGAANKGDWRFTEYANNAFTRDRLLRADALFTKAADSMLQNKEMAMRNASNPYKMSAWDGKTVQFSPTSGELLMQQGSEPWHLQQSRSFNDGLQLALPSASLKGAIAVGMATNGGINAATQFYNYGEIKYPMELGINIGFGAIEAYLGKYSGNGWKGVALEATIGVGSNVAAALVAEKYYNFDIDHKTDVKSLIFTGAIGAGFGSGMKANEEYKLLDKAMLNIKLLK